MKKGNNYRKSCLWNYIKEIGSLPPESDDKGNIEYKLKLIDPSPERLEQLITQLKWRMSEGDGEAMYEIGFDDDGTIVGLSSEELSASLRTLHRMAEALDAKVSVVRKAKLREIKEVLLEDPSRADYTVLEAEIRRSHNQQDQQGCNDIRIAFVGGHGEGKSTLLGFVTHGIKDNGRGKARLLRHRHEIESGRTSSISHEIIGYDARGNLINNSNHAPHGSISSWEQICESSNKIVTFMDTCGHRKYLRTTIFGLTGYAPDYACIVISATLPNISEMSREHLSISVMLGVPVFVVVTKIDIASREQVRRTLHTLASLLRNRRVKKIPFVVKHVDEVPMAATQLSRGGPETPVFVVSNVSGTNTDLLLRFFHYLPRPTKHYDDLLEEPVEFQVAQVYSLPDVGPVISGVLRRGRINVKEQGDQKMYHLGPDTLGRFVKVRVKSIHRHRVPAHYVHCGQTATLAIDGDFDEDWSIQRGMVLLGTGEPECFYEFEAEITVLYHPTGLTTGTCGMIHSGSVRQRARVISVMCDHHHQEEQQQQPVIVSGEQGRCILRFMDKPEYLSSSTQILFIDAHAKCLGRVVRLIQ